MRIPKRAERPDIENVIEESTMEIVSVYEWPSHDRAIRDFMEDETNKMWILTAAIDSEDVFGFLAKVKYGMLPWREFTRILRVANDHRVFIEDDNGSRRTRAAWYDATDLYGCSIFVADFDANDDTSAYYWEPIINHLIREFRENEKACLAEIDSMP